MSGISGFSNQKKLGGSQFASVQGTGSDKFGINTAQMYLFDITPSAIAITGVTQDPVIVDKVWLEIVSHGAKVGDVIRFTSNADALFGWELDVVDVLDSNTVAVHNISFINNTPTLPSIGEMVKTCRWVTAKADSEGALTTSSGPAQYIKNGATQTVAQDTVTPANNNPLPAGLYIIKDGVVVPVLKDTGLPSNTVGIPVEVVAASGTPINITAGDLNVQLSDQGVNYDSTRIGDGINLLLVNADGSINVQDAAALAKLATLAAVDFATGGKQDLAKAVLDLIKTNGDTLNAKDFSTSAKQDAAKTVLDSINTKDFSTAAKQDLAKAVLDVIQTNTLNTSSKLPATLGQKAMAASLAVTIASDQSSVPITVETLNQQSLTAGALNADLIPSTDVSKYAYVSLQIAGTWSGIITLQGSNDNATWTAVNLQAITSGSSGVTSSISINTFAVAPIYFKYLRARMTSYTSGTATGAAFFSVAAPDSLGADTVLQAGAWSVTTTASAVAGTVSSAQVSVGTTAVRATVAGTAPNAARKLLLIKPSKNNTGAIYIGPSTVTAANGMEILGPDRVEFDFDAGDYYLISDTVGQTVEILEKI